MLQERRPSDSQVFELVLLLLTERLYESFELILIGQTEFLVALKDFCFVLLFGGLSSILLLCIFELFELRILHIFGDFYHRRIVGVMAVRKLLNERVFEPFVLLWRQVFEAKFLYQNFDLFGRRLKNLCWLEHGLFRETNIFIDTQTLRFAVGISSA